MTVLNNLYLRFGKSNCLLLVTYIIVILIAFPLEGIYLPRQYTMMIKNLTENSKNIAHVFIVIILVLVITTVLSAARNTISIELFPKRLLHYARKEIYNNIVDRYSTEFKQLKTADTIERINGISDNITFNAQWAIKTGLPLVLAMIVIIVYFFTKNTTIGIIAVTGFTLNLLITMQYGKEIIKQSIQRESVFINTSQKINNSLDNLKNIYINSKSQHNKMDVQENNHQHSKELHKELLLGRNMKIIVKLVTLATLLSVIYFLYNQLFGTKVSTPSERFEGGAIIFIYLTYMAWMNELFLDLPYVFHRLGVISTSNDFLEEVFQKTTHGKNISGITNGEIEFKNLSFAFDDTENIIDNESYLFEGSKMTCIKGRSGSGKSIIAHLIVSLYTPNKGEILIDGINIQQYDQKYLRNNIVYVNQLNDMFEESIKYNMLYGTTGKENELKRILETYNLEKLYETVGGINTIITSNGSSLSSGMKKIIIILRGILKKEAKIYIFDEPTAGLDTNTTNIVLELIQTECKGKTVILITHSDIVTALCQKNILVAR